MKQSFLTLILAGMIVLTGYLAGYAQDDRDDATTFFTAAQQAYKASDFEAAVTQYERIIAAGYESGPVYYNLGNSYYHLDRIGKALVNYERALRFMPRDSDLRFNYTYTKSRIKNDIKPKQVSFVAKLLNKHIAFYSVPEMIKIMVLLGMLASGLYLASLFARWSQRWVVLCIGLALGINVIFGIGLWWSVQTRAQAAIVLQKTKARFEPRDQSTVHFSISEGVRVRVLKTDGTWSKVRRPDGKLGWIRGEVVEAIAL